MAAPTLNYLLWRILMMGHSTWLNSVLLILHMLLFLKDSVLRFSDIRTMTTGRPKQFQWIQEAQKIDAYAKTRHDPKQVIGKYKEIYGISSVIPKCILCHLAADPFVYLLTRYIQDEQRDSLFTLIGLINYCLIVHQFILVAF
ncbi:hypothetical protein SUGI_0530640 [Cryptomeria japonica]|nr:hypothetical protein SUGI_0530640 [Cryptomeria japonica]